MFIRVGVVQLSLDAFRGLNKADRARYAGDKRYDPRYISATSDADRRAFDRDRQRRIREHRERAGWDAGDTPPQRRRRNALPDWMAPGQTAQRGRDLLTAQPNANWARRSDPDDQVSPEHSASVARFDLPDRHP